ncbi:hypothetical protein QBZ16_001474 [Prototheca wickerhamii]|uniref:Uncharacterized protein n=1 Tax=Prototheca wickerhamii TaxID=3111 RepID=A0AAD9IE30_PROWI|nr:hypothetical protein QBZ16_001474 [Prototheca wickerhamii]
MSGAKAAKTLVESLKRHVTSTMGNPAIERYFANVFAAEVQRPEGARLAEDYAFLLESIAGHRQDLLLSYNIGVDPELRQKEMYKKAATRVGLSLPEEELDARLGGRRPGNDE